MTSTPTSAVGRTVHRVGAVGEILDWLVSPVWEHPCLELDQVVPRDGEPWDRDGHPGRWRLTNGPDAAPVKALLYGRRPLPTIVDCRPSARTPGSPGPGSFRAGQSS